VEAWRLSVRGLSHSAGFTVRYSASGFHVALRCRTFAIIEPRAAYASLWRYEVLSSFCATELVRPPATFRS
jgi:hypothetical protein